MKNNKLTIEFLASFLRKAEQKQIEFNSKDYYGHSFYEEEAECDNEKVRVRWTDFGDNNKPYIIIEAYIIPQKGKYGIISLSSNSLEKNIWHFSKELKGKGNGFYADIDKNSLKILKSEND